MELIIPLDPQGKKPLYEQIYRHIKTEIRNGNLKPQMRLPSTRRLAENLKVSRSTTQLAYEQLVSEGYLEAVPRKGYFPARLEGLVAPVETKGADPAEPGAEFGREGTEAAAGERSGGAYPVLADFSPAGIDLENFPFSAWRRISRSVLKEEERDMFLKGDPQGDLSLRKAIRDYLHTARGVNCSPAQIIIGAGNEYLLMLLSQLLGQKTGIAMENPTYGQAFRVFSAMGHRVFPVGMDQSGFLVSELSELSDGAAYVMPSHQFPMGIVMPARRRQELLSWAQAFPGRYLIEDDYDSEFRYKGKPVPALQGMDRGQRVIYMGTFSKAIAPAIRVGYMVLPQPLLERYRESARFYSSTVSRVDQRILTQFIAEGYFERHLNRMRERYKGKHDLLLSLLRPLEARFEIQGEYAGLHVLLKGKAGQTEQELVSRAAKAGVRIYGLSGFFMDRTDHRETGTVLLGYGGLTEEEIRTGAGLLLKIMGE